MVLSFLLLYKCHHENTMIRKNLSGSVCWPAFVLAHTSLRQLSVSRPLNKLNLDIYPAQKATRPGDVVLSKDELVNAMSLLSASLQTAAAGFHGSKVAQSNPNVLAAFAVTQIRYKKPDISHSLLPNRKYLSFSKRQNSTFLAPKQLTQTRGHKSWSRPF